MLPRRHDFPRSARLLTPSDFRPVFEASIKSADRCFVILARRTGEAPARLGLAIAKRHVRAAVQRNRIKRLIRESFRHSRAALAGLDLVVMARPGLVDRNNRELSDSLRRHWNRLGDVSRA